MKKFNSVKRMSIKATAALLCLATSATCMTFVAPLAASVHADTDTAAKTAVSATIVENANIPESCDYDGTFKVPAAATVIAPNGKELELTADNGVKTVRANQIGNYKVKFADADSGLDYTFNVKVRLDEEFFLKVDYNGADIPSYLAVGGTFTLPGASVYYYDENNILTEYPGKVNLTISDSVGSEGLAAEKEYKAGTTTGKVYLTYSASIGEGGQKYFSETFTINVQTSVPGGTGNPTLSVSGVQKDVSINRPVTLPKATATDTYDEKVKVEVEVLDPDGKKVKYVEIDEDGYATAEKDKEVIFDNDKAMTFYPTKLGTYTVKYNATNDRGGKASEKSYFMTVSDLVAPIFKDVDDWSIPEKWGLTVTDANGATVENGGKITFTVPTVVDNLDNKDIEGSKPVSMYFRITDSDNSKTIVEFSDIYADPNDTTNGEKCKFTYTDTYNSEKKGQKVTFSNKDESNNTFTFDFNLYNKTNSAGDKQALAGTYTVLYRARDNANNTSSKSYTITLEETYEEATVPTAPEITVPDYISVAEDTFTVPYASISDTKDSRLNKVYRIYNDAGKSVDVEGGEVADIKKVTNDEGVTTTYLVFDGEEFSFTDNLYFYVAATDDAGNFNSNVIDSETKKAVALDAETNPATLENCKAKIKVVEYTASASMVYNGTGMTATVNNTEKYVTEDGVKVGAVVSYGGFTITTDEALRNYTGFEVGVYDPNGDAIDVTLETMSTVNAGKAKIIVQNIAFKLSTETEDDEDYKLIVRVFDVNGNNKVFGYTLGMNVISDGTGSVTTQAISTIGGSGDVSVTYKLPNDSISGIVAPENTVYRVVRRIKGVSFSLMGSEFTAKSQGDYTIYDSYIKEVDDAEDVGYVKGADTFDYDYATAVGGNNGVHNVFISETATPVIEIQGVMPTYQAFDKKTGEGDKVTQSTDVVLPAIVAYTDNGDATVDIEVTGPKNSNKVEVKTDDDGVKSFTATDNGSYVVKVTATYGYASSNATYTINIGDVQGPEFTLDYGTESTTLNKTYTVGDKFKFAVMKLAGTEDSETTVQITKTLVNPSKENVADAVIEGSFSNNATRLDNNTDITFDMAGTYKVIYTAKDAYGNETKQEFEITVVSSGTSTPTTWTTLSTVLIIVAVVLLAGVIVYVVRFRKVRK